MRENIVEVKIPRERITLGEIPEHEFGSYYGLPGATFTAGANQEAVLSAFGYHNVPAASFFDGSGASTAVTTKNFAEILNKNLVVREILKTSESIPDDLINFPALYSIKDNTELIFINGLLQTQGAEYDYSISGAKTVVFSENVENDDFIVVTYIKG